MEASLSVDRIFNDTVTQCEQKVVKGIAEVLGNVLSFELRLLIYEFLCHNANDVRIPNRGHCFFHEHLSNEKMSYEASGKTNEYDDDGKEDDEKIDLEISALRNQPYFTAASMGPRIANEITKVFLERNAFHFPGATRCMKDFLNTPFPTGCIPREHIRDLTIYVRCEGFLEDAGLDWYGCGDYVGTVEEDYPYEELAVCPKYRRELAFIQRIPFTKIPKVTLVIVHPFDRGGTENVQKERLSLNFQEVILPVFQYFKDSGSPIRVVEKGIRSLFDSLELVVYEEEDVTWKVELANEVYQQVIESKRTFEANQLTRGSLPAHFP